MNVESAGQSSPKKINKRLVGQGNVPNKDKKRVTYFFKGRQTVPGNKWDERCVRQI